MGAYSIAEAKAHLSALLDSVVRSEEVTITKRGVPVAVISPIAKAGGEINWQRRAPRLPKTSWVKTVRQLRDDRY